VKILTTGEYLKILACMPTHKAMEIEGVRSLLKMQELIFRDGNEFQLITHPGFNPYFKRNLLLKKALEINPDWVLSLDSDHIYSKDALDTLISHDLDIVAAKYYVSGGVGVENRPLAMGRWVDGKFDLIRKQDEEQGIVEVDVVGFGFTLIKPSALKKIYKDGDSFMTPSGVVQETDDSLFCKRAKDCGLKIYYDSDVTIGHLTLTTAI
jgi:cellulose synthase/poly-beta-1,6-N-acetylglucosamine synthase-like glycosyltransferase